MYYYIEGQVAATEPGLAVIDCNGVGYACHVSQNTLSALKLGEHARLYTHLYVREDIFDLYGFFNMEEKSCFRMLTSVSGVGPKAALSILSVAPPSRLALAIITGEDKMLTQAAGIGKKIAQRIVMELKDKMAKEQQNGGMFSMPADALQGGSSAVNHTQEAVAALMVLGYSQSEALSAMQSLPIDGMTTEEIVRRCLQQFAAKL